ncbi:MAG: hypothetical protein JW819_00545 [Candidatus Krumholzibacteriota bacterium]|nr:hypothetical protein [Candidatus Krumholzibacteriota bacterium]
MRPVDSLTALKYQPGPRPAAPPPDADKSFRPQAAPAATAGADGAATIRPRGLADLGQTAPPASLSRTKSRGAAASPAGAAGGAGNARNATKANVAPALQKAAREFEGILMLYLASAMWDTLPAGGTGGMQGAHFYQGMIEEQLGRLLVEGSRGPGLADAIVRQVSAETKENA